ncbi:hypothetical protein IFM89_019633 [Coptis chinensis]|uniref:Amino acid transporter transmembrane domain-containing protein n=1 Tax=Coptis chinensis TaxID=261450 RepID=A0A835IB95_9MAGN|nr:hypothetical protein IFM89_019633 [Coptis chinensis]
MGGMDIEKEGENMDDDGRPKRSGTVWTGSAHIITAVIGSGVLSLPWAIAQFGWLAGPVALFTFSFITYFTSSLLADCYRSPDPVLGKRNYSYMEAVRANSGRAVKKSNCFHFRGHQTSCKVSNNPYMISFGIVQVVLSQIPNIHKLSWLSSVAAIMSFCYAFIGVALSVAQIISDVVVLTGFGFYEPFWLVDFANVCIAVHLVGAFQVFSQPLFAAVETWAAWRWCHSKLINRDYIINIKGTHRKYKINLFRLIWRTSFVVLTTVFAMAMPFFNDVVALLGAIGYWPLTVYFPIEMYISQKKIQRFTYRWFGLQILNFFCLLVALAAACGSIQGITKALHVSKPFRSK